MNRTLIIEITNKKPFLRDKTPLVCGNSGYFIDFTFDSEWDNHEVKTAMFRVGDKTIPQVFSGTRCEVPVLQNTRMVSVGVFAGTVDDGTLSTSMPALIECLPCITDGVGEVVAPPEDDVYKQIVALCDDAVKTANDVEERANNGEFNGEPYVLTEEDKEKIVTEVLKELPNLDEVKF